GVFGRRGRADVVARRPLRQGAMVNLPKLTPPLLNLRPDFKLRKEEGGQNVRWQVARADVHPSVFVHLAAEEARAVGALFADDLRALDVVGIVDQQRTALAAGDVLGLVKTLGRERTEGPQVFPAVLG